MFESKQFRRDARGSAIASLAKTAAAASLLGLVAAECLAALAQRGGLPRITLVWPDAEMQRLAKSAPPAQAGGGFTVYRDIGVDGMTTSAIPRIVNGAGPLTPCGQPDP